MPLSPAGRVALGSTALALMFGVLLALIGWGLSPFWTGPRPLEPLTADAVIGEWSATGPAGEPAIIRFAEDGTFTIAGMPDGAFCAGAGPHRIADEDWRDPESVAGTWELDPGAQADPLRLADDRECMTRAVVEADADATYLVLWIGWFDEGATDLRFRRLDGAP